MQKGELKYCANEGEKFNKIYKITDQLESTLKKSRQ